MTLYESLQKELGDKLRGLEQLDGSYRLLKTPQLIGDFFEPRWGWGQGGRLQGQPPYIGRSYTSNTKSARIAP